MSDHVFGVEDDGSGRAALDVAGQAVKAFNHRTSERFDDRRSGWNHVPDAYRVLGELTYLTGMLPQVLQHLSQAMSSQARAGHVGADRDSEYDGRPDAAIAAAVDALTLAGHGAQELYSGLAAAQNAIARLHYAGPDLDGRDGA